MPSQRFNKLKQVKKNTLLAAAYKEFSLHSYEGASITKLVADLKMAKGSIYQYFNDKQDLYTYLVDQAYSKLYQVLSKACPIDGTANNFMAWYKNFLLVQLKFYCAIPSYAFLISRHKAEFLQAHTPNEKWILAMISQCSVGSISHGKEFYLNALPQLVFKHLVEAEKIDVSNIIESGDRLKVSNDKLLYLCEAFLTNISL